MELVYLNSGGVDSLAAGLIMKKKGHVLRSLYIDFGQDNTKPAQKAARKIAKKLCKSHYVMTLKGKWQFRVEGSLLKKSVPFQSILVTDLAKLYCLKIKADGITGGMCREGDENPMIPREYNKIFEGGGRKHKVIWPVYKMNKKKIMKIASKDKELFDITVGCNVNPPCGDCPKCNNRKLYGFAEKR